MLQEIEIKQENPFDVETIDEFLFYCCPKCEMKHPTKDQFSDHAMKLHPESEKYIYTIAMVQVYDREQSLHL